MHLFTLLFSLVAGFWIITAQNEALASDLPEAERDLRISQLLPHLLCPLAVEPAIPVEFIALSHEEDLNPYGWTYWGPEKVLKAFFTCARRNFGQQSLRKTQISQNINFAFS